VTNPPTESPLPLVEEAREAVAAFDRHRDTDLLTRLADRVEALESGSGSV
jgi:hypothetical protein